MGFLGTPLGWIMYAIESFIHNYGISLILFVILTKVVLLPLTIKQQKTTAKTASISPRLKELEKKFGKDKAKYQEAMMKLYEEEGVNPAGGCLPMIVQFALLFGVIDVIYKPLKHLLRIPTDLIQKATDLVGVSAGSEISIINQVQTDPSKFMSIFGEQTVKQIEDFNMTFFGLNLGEVPPLAFTWLLLIPLISGSTALLMSVISMKQQERNGQKMQGMMKYMMYFSPLMSVWFGFSLPIGVSIYWIVSNVFALVQQIILGRVYTPEKLATMNDKSMDKNREKMRIKREKMEEYNKRMEASGRAPKALPKAKTDSEEKLDKDSALKAKEIERNRIAEARRRIAEKYGEDYTNDGE